MAIFIIKLIIYLHELKCRPVDHEEQQNEAHVENVEQYHVHEENGNTYSTDFYDPFYQRNYEMPTEASKMKRVNRPYLHSFHISSIPFVVGTSISPSHNIGLNIQQVNFRIFSNVKSILYDFKNFLDVKHYKNQAAYNIWNKSLVNTKS